MKTGASSRQSAWRANISRGGMSREADPLSCILATLNPLYCLPLNASRMNRLMRST
ncbi:hypothetical protein BMETH_1240_0 [methanotrophic bacterial endosymbiont of Bathymodiolus sp.]|nr:hypothetical protein BMETH_1240_0 [methanotrophic bacterial endosymbiont of Bathymodiolus sp.]